MESLSRVQRWLKDWFENDVFLCILNVFVAGIEGRTIEIESCQYFHLEAMNVICSATSLE